METNELTKPDSFIETELQRFEKIITKEQLITLADSVKDLVIKDTEDKVGLKAVIEGRKQLKAQRVAIQKEAKNIRELAVRFQKAVIARENEYVGLVEPTEDTLAGREEWYYVEKARLDAEEEKRESDRIQTMIDQLGAVRHAVDFHELKALTEVQFQNILTEATIKYQADLKAEEEERQKQYELRLQEETRLQQAQKEQEERERLFKIEQDKVKTENERIKKEQEERQRLIDEANEKSREEIRVMERQTREKMAEIERQVAEQKEAARKEQLAKEEEARKKQEEIDRKRLKKEEEAEKLLQSDDTDKFSVIFSQIEAIRKSTLWGTFKSKNGKNVAVQVQNALLLASSFSSQISKIASIKSQKAKGVAKEEVDINYDFHEGRGEGNELLS